MQTCRPTWGTSPKSILQRPLHASPTADFLHLFAQAEKTKHNISPTPCKTKVCLGSPGPRHSARPCTIARLGPSTRTAAAPLGWADLAPGPPIGTVADRAQCTSDGPGIATSLALGNLQPFDPFCNLPWICPTLRRPPTHHPTKSFSKWFWSQSLFLGLRFWH